MPSKMIQSAQARTANAKAINGTDKSEIVLGTSGEDQIKAGSGNDHVFGLAKADRLFGGIGHDDLYGGLGNDTLLGGKGNDNLFGGFGQDTYFGGAGSDRFVLGNLTFGEKVFGGANGDAAGEFDALDLTDLQQGVFVDLDGTTAGTLSGDAAVTQAGFVQVRDDFGSDAPRGQVDVFDVEKVTGTPFDDVLFGNQEVNILIGGAGNDIIHPFSTHDLNDGKAPTQAELNAIEFVDGGTGVDLLNLFGATGQLLVNLSTGKARTFADAGEGAVADGLKVFTGFENVNGSRFFSDQILGDARDNLLNGNGGNDTLFGGAGNDTLSGGDDDDLLRGANGNDVLESGSGIDTVFGGGGVDTFVVNGDPFDGETPAAKEAGQILGVNAPDEIQDFNIDKDIFAVDGVDFGIDSFKFSNGLVDNLSGDATFLVLQDEFVNARAAAQAIADNDNLTADEGVFVYFNSTLGINRLVYSEDLGDGGAFSVLSNLNNISGNAAVNALPDFTADNFELV